MSDIALVGIIMGSQSDWKTMKHAADTLDALNIPYEARIVSAHRTPKRLYDYADKAADRGLKVIIAGAGGAAHLPGMAAAMTPFLCSACLSKVRPCRAKTRFYRLSKCPPAFPWAHWQLAAQEL